MLQREQPKPQSCAACAAPSETDVWGNRVCYRCFGEWIRDDRFSAGAINAALGLSNSPEEFTEAGHKRYCAEATKRTKAWLAEKKTARAA